MQISVHQKTESSLSGRNISKNTTEIYTRSIPFGLSYLQEYFIRSIRHTTDFISRQAIIGLRHK